LGRRINASSVNEGKFIWPFERTKEILSSADITIGNLECPLINNCPKETQAWDKLCADERFVGGLKIFRD